MSKSAAKPFVLYYSSVDGYQKTTRYASLKGLRKAAFQRVGEHADLGTGYAVSSDGVGVVRVGGVTLREVFQPEAVRAYTEF